MRPDRYSKKTDNRLATALPRFLSRLFLLALLPFALLLQSCNKESPLSNTEITDPSILTAQFTISKNKKQSTGSSDYTFQASILDKKDRYVEILNGNVFLNGIKMNPQRAPYENVTRYFLYTDKIKFKLDSLYTFTVVLSDGASYSSSIRTPATDMISTVANSAGDSISFTWVGNAADSIEVYYGTQGIYDEPGTVGWYYIQRKDPQGQNKLTFKFDPGRIWVGAYNITTFRRNSVHPAFRRGWMKASIELGSD
jgi:hypothetical protein